MLAGKVCESRCWLLRYYWATGHSGNYCRLTKGRQSQSNIASLVLTCEDVGAGKAIIVTPNPLQRGASILANYHGVMHFKLDPKSSESDFLADALGKLFLGIPSIGESSNIGTPSIGPS